jgi:hypothetical protein
MFGEAAGGLNIMCDDACVLEPGVNVCAGGMDSRWT